MSIRRKTPLRGKDGQKHKLGRGGHLAKAVEVEGGFSLGGGFGATDQVSVGGLKKKKPNETTEWEEEIGKQIGSKLSDTSSEPGFWGGVSLTERNSPGGR